MFNLHLRSSICLHGVVLNRLNTETVFCFTCKVYKCLTTACFNFRVEITSSLLLVILFPGPMNVISWDG
jgi:hypothetical protein